LLAARFDEVINRWERCAFHLRLLWQ